VIASIRIFTCGFVALAVVFASGCASSPSLTPAPASPNLVSRTHVPASLLPIRRDASSSAGINPCAKPHLSPAVRTEKKLVYVAGYGGPLGSMVGCVELFRPGIGSPIGIITSGVSMPTGIFVDAKSNLYVANGGESNSAATNTVTVYPPGHLKPSTTYTGFFLPESIAVGDDGTAYIADAIGSPSGGGVVREYKSGSTTPSSSLTMPGSYAMAVALDSSNNLYVSWWTMNTSKIDIYKYAPGSTTGTHLVLDLPPRTVPAHTIAFDDKGDLVIPVEEGLDGRIAPEFLAVYSPGLKTSHKIWLGSLANLVFGVAFPRSNPKDVYITGANGNALLLLTYPRALLRDGASVGAAAGLALSPGF
jgi:hypothetical protein